MFKTIIKTTGNNRPTSHMRSDVLRAVLTSTLKMEEASLQNTGNGLKG
jgi:hypothetical protein